MFATRENLKVPSADSNKECSSAAGPRTSTCARFGPLPFHNLASSLPFASIALKENRTGTVFPGEFCRTSTKDCPVLVGVGSRRKKLLGVKSVDVYAVGLYVDDQATKQLLAPLRGKGTAAAQADQSLLDEVVVSDDIEKTIRIVVTSGLVTHDRFLNGLKDSLVPACKKVNDENSLVEFERLFEGVNFHKGLEMAFTSTKSGGLAARIGNSDVGEITSRPFTQAFFGLYLGGNPVSPDGKANMSRGIADIVANE